MNGRKNIFFALPFLPVLFIGCYNDNAEDLYPTSNCDTSAVTYAAVIKPITDANCAVSGCHTGSFPAGGLDYSTHEDLATVASNGKLIAAIEHTGPNPMPQGGAKLDNCTITKIKKWVAEGARNN